MSILILLVGHNGSGKSTLARQLVLDFPHLNMISGDEVRVMAKQHIAYFHDLDYSFPSEKNDLLNHVIHVYRNELTTRLLQNGQDVLIDASNYVVSLRAERIAVARPYASKIVFIYCDTTQDVIKERLKKRGQRWLEQYEKIKRPKFEPPSKQECDELLLYTQHNYHEVKKRLASLLSSK